MDMPADSKGLRAALRVLGEGGVIVYPSESSYGIGCDFTDKQAVERIYGIKQRRGDKQFIVLVDSLRTAGTHAQISAAARRLAHAFMPGGITLVVKAYFGGTLAFRVSSHPFAQELCRQFKKPVVSTSANISGNVPIYDIDDVRRMFKDKVELIVDGGNLPKRPLTTVYDVAHGKILRRGAISEEEIRKALEN